MLLAIALLDSREGAGDETASMDMVSIQYA